MIKFLRYSAEGFRTPQATHSELLPSRLTIEGALVKDDNEMSDFLVEFCREGYGSVRKPSLIVKSDSWELSILKALGQFVRCSDIKTSADTSDDSRILWAQMEIFLGEMLR